MAIVKCKYCGKEFDRAKESFVQYPFGSRFRYAHDICEPNKELKRYNRTCHVCGKADDNENLINMPGVTNLWVHPDCLKSYHPTEQEQLDWYLMKLFGWDFVPVPVKKTIKTYNEKYNYSFKAIRHTLEWWYEIEKNDIRKANGNIHIVPYIIDKAKAYWKTKEQAEVANKDIEIKPAEDIKVKLKTPQRQRFRSVDLSFLEEDVDGE